jgi:hypothetical protein
VISDLGLCGSNRLARLFLIEVKRYPSVDGHKSFDINIGVDPSFYIQNQIPQEVCLDNCCCECSIYINNIRSIEGIGAKMCFYIMQIIAVCQYLVSVFSLV